MATATTIAEPRVVVAQENPNHTLGPFDTELVEYRPVARDTYQRLPNPHQLTRLLTGGNTHLPWAALPPQGTSYVNDFAAEFGRDSAMQALMSSDRAFKKLVIVKLLEKMGFAHDQLRADLQDVAKYAARLEELGKIFHEHNPRNESLIKEGIEFPWYHSDDSTVLTLRLILSERFDEDWMSFLAQTQVEQRDGRTHTPLESVRSMLQFVSTRIGIGGLFYTQRMHQTRPDGSVSIGAYGQWQDSFDSTTRKDGSLAMGPVAFAENQANLHYVFTRIHELSEQHPWVLSIVGPYAANGESIAREISTSYRQRGFFRDSQGEGFTYGLENIGDGIVHALTTRKSNVAHLLHSNLLSSDDYARLIYSIFSESSGLISPQGIRTTGEFEITYGPGRYHQGSVWLWENVWAAAGLEDHGYSALAFWLDIRTVETCLSLKHFGEFVRGDGEPGRPAVSGYVAVAKSTYPRTTDQRLINRQNTIVQPEQPLQGWTLHGFINAVERLQRLGWKMPEPKTEYEAAILRNLDRRFGVMTPKYIEVLRNEVELITNTEIANTNGSIEPIGISSP